MSKDDFEHELDAVIKSGYSLKSTIGHQGTIDYLKREFPKHEYLFVLNRIEITKPSSQLVVKLRHRQSEGEVKVDLTDDDVQFLEVMLQHP